MSNLKMIIDFIYDVNSVGGGERERKRGRARV